MKVEITHRIFDYKPEHLEALKLLGHGVETDDRGYVWVTPKDGEDLSLEGGLFHLWGISGEFRLRIDGEVEPDVQPYPGIGK